jgi:hypothetical protein
MNTKIEWKVTKIDVMPPSESPNTDAFVAHWDCQCIVGDFNSPDIEPVIQHSFGRSLIQTDKFGLTEIKFDQLSELQVADMVKDTIGKEQVASLEELVKKMALETAITERGYSPMLPWVPPEPEPEPETVKGI